MGLDRSAEGLGAKDRADGGTGGSGRVSLNSEDSGLAKRTRLTNDGGGDGGRTLGGSSERICLIDNGGDGGGFGGGVEEVRKTVEWRLG